jgi:hypothetical protein
MTSAIIILLIIVLFIYPQNTVQPRVYNQSLNMSEACSSIQLNKTNLTNFSLKMQFAKSSQDSEFLRGEESTSKIISLDLSSNLLEAFSDNYLPDL